MELRHLITLAVVANARSFREASARLGYVQSAVSQHVADLERLANARLLERSRGGAPVRVTAAGRMLLAHAEEIVARIGAARADLAALARLEPLRVGLHEAVTGGIAPAILRALGPEARVRLAEPSECRLAELVEHGELELGFAALPLPPGPFEYVELVHEPLVLIVPTSSPLAGRRRAPTRAELAELPFIGRAGTRLGERIERDLREHGHAPRVVQRVGSDAAARALVAAGLGTAIVPSVGAQPAEPGVTTIDLGGILAPRVLVLLWHRARRLDASAERFRDVAVDVCARLG